MVTKEATSQQIQEEVRVKQAAATEAVAPAERVPAPPSTEEVRYRIEAHIKSMKDELEARMPDLEAGMPRIETAELLPWWDLFVVGPIQNPPFRQPSGVIALGETAFIVTIVVANPLPILAGPISPLAIMAGANARAEIKYRTGNLDTWTPSEPSANSVVPINGVLNVDIQPFLATTIGVKDLSVSARVTTPGPGTWPFGGHASLMFSFDLEPLLSFFGFPGATPGFANKVPCRFSVYQPG
jgi:hypothetical protein